MGWAGPMTHKQFMAWQEWDRQQNNKPSRSDHYLMQIAMEVRAVPFSFSSYMPTLNLNQFKIPFKTVKEEPFNPEGSKQTWLSLLRASSGNVNRKG